MIPFARLLGKKNEESPEPGSLLQAVKEAYSGAADDPEGKHPFPVGRAFAESVGYPAEILNELPEASVESFAGVSNLAVYADIPEGAEVLDFGCGAGLDAIIAARRVGPSGSVLGIDFSMSMIDKAQKAAAETGLKNVSFNCIDAEKSCVDDGSVDVVLVNGIFNLNPDREAIFECIFKALRAGGRVYASELILKDNETADTVCSIKDWFA